MKQLIFVVETDSSTQSDDRYIKKLLIQRYDFSSNEIKIQFVHMAGKSKYNSKSVLSLINKYKAENKNSENHIIYCFDTDKIDSDYRYKNEFTEEKQFCDRNNYKLIWFNYDIEYVLLGECIAATKKKQESIKYYNQNRTIPMKKLYGKNQEIRGYSNIFLVLDDILPLKN